VKIAIGAVALARFTEADTRDLYDIRNHESVRAFMANPAPLEFEAHRRWTRAHLLASEDLLLLLVRVRGAARGFSLLKRLSPDTAEVGLMLRDATRHPVIASTAAVATVYCAFELLGYASLVSWARPDHPRALSINQAFGGIEVPSQKPGMLQFQASREQCLGNANYRRVLERIRPRLRVER
jgi:RimJ/RimL family protein N-acetyltransferase